MKFALGRRTVLLATAAAVVVASVVAFAYAATSPETAVIAACVKDENGQVRVVASASDCNRAEHFVSWNKEGVIAYRTTRATPNEVPVTGLATGGIGLPGPGDATTPVLALALPEGVYFLTATLGVRKDFGNGDFLCWVSGPGFNTSFMRTSLGADAGHVRRANLSSDGLVRIGAGGATVTLSCWQAANPNVPGSPSGENPTVFIAQMTATTVERGRITIAPSGTVIDLP